jgi:hypothetical protein
LPKASLLGLDRLAAEKREQKEFEDLQLSERKRKADSNGRI